MHECNKHRLYLTIVLALSTVIGAESATFMRQGAQGRCTGMNLRDGMQREVGGGFRMGDTCPPMADSCECLAKTTTIFLSN